MLIQGNRRSMACQTVQPGFIMRLQAAVHGDRLTHRKMSSQLPRPGSTAGSDAASMFKDCRSFPTYTVQRV